MNIAVLDTPTLVADLDVLERNIEGMAAALSSTRRSTTRAL